MKYLLKLHLTFLLLRTVERALGELSCSVNHVKVLNTKELDLIIQLVLIMIY